MHHHRLVLNGRPAPVRRLVAELCRAGATVVADGAAPKLVWSTSDARLVERLAARHAEVVVGIERFAALGDELLRLVVSGTDTTILDRRPILPPPDDALEGWGAEGLHFDPELLHRAARRVERHAAERAGRAEPDGLGGARVVGEALGVVCRADGGEVVEAVAGLAAAAVEVGAAATLVPAEARVERAWVLAWALRYAEGEGVGEVAWEEWLGVLVGATAEVLLACVEGVDAAGTAVAAIHREHCATPAEQRAAAAGVLVATALQALALFDQKPR